ncbi:hypothetical protein HYX08_07315 [Candidatus Woesearchaeota archaeon]|nr:hypothetical protein [Candidatus Woesearchaeota archaeon]
MKKAIIFAILLITLLPNVFAEDANYSRWSLNNADISGTIIADTGNTIQRNATLRGGQSGTTLVSGLAEAVYFNGGAGQFIVLDNMTSYLKTQNVGEICLWFNSTNNAEDRGMLFHFTDSGTTDTSPALFYWVGGANDGDLAIYTSNTVNRLRYATNVLDGVKHFACFGSNASKNSLFYDGTEVTDSLTVTDGANDGSWMNDGTANFDWVTVGHYRYNNVEEVGIGDHKGAIDEVCYFNRTLTSAERSNLYNSGSGATCASLFAGPDTTPPNITYYNLTSSTNGCENWYTNKSNPCSTSSVLPTVQFNTNENAWCAIGGAINNGSLNRNYTAIGSSRNCTGASAGEGTTSHLCTLTSQDELVYDTSYLFISCKDASNNTQENSTSGALSLSITGLEAAGRSSIGIGVQNALLSGYTNYTDLQIYARNLSNGQARGTFDRAVKKNNKVWAFNRIGVSDSYVNMFNLTPVLYTLELANKTSSNITLEVEKLINATK